MIKKILIILTSITIIPVLYWAIKTSYELFYILFELPKVMEGSVYSKENYEMLVGSSGASATSFIVVLFSILYQRVWQFTKHVKVQIHMLLNTGITMNIQNMILELILGILLVIQVQNLCNKSVSLKEDWWNEKNHIYSINCFYPLLCLFKWDFIWC